MAQESNIKEFPDIGNKLTAPTKKSLFERQKAEAEAKRQREQEETAAVYEDFVKSFDDEGNDLPSGVASRRGAPGSGGAFSKRHFSGPPSGPAGRGGFGAGRGNSGPGSLGPPPASLSRKRAYDGLEPARREGLFAFEDGNTGPTDAKTAFQHSDDEDAGESARSQERAIPKPTMRLTSLPPGTSPAAIKAAIPVTLTVEGVRIIPPSGPGTNSMERRSVSAVVTLAKDTPAMDIDTAVSALQNRYMGRGYYLSISRHLSSASIGLDTPALGLSSSSSLPFGARPVPPPPLGRAPPSGIHRGGFAPPTSYTTPQNQYGRGAPQMQVSVTQPSDLKQLRIIHKTLEALLTHGPEFEALLMSRKDVQLDEKWAWLWDSRSVGGVYYRWRLWEILTGAYRRRGRRFASAPQTVFENGAPWVAPEQKLPYEFITRLSEFVSDSDYDSSEDEDSGDEGRRRYAQHHGGALPPDGPSLEGDSQAYLNPLRKAKLTHLLARLPTTNAKLRRGDVARVTAFAIQYAGEGAEEVVQMVVFNVRKPFAFTSANPDYQANSKAEEPEKLAGEETPQNLIPRPDQKPKEEDEDTTPAKLVALYIVSDILSSSSTSGVRHAWRYRQLFETHLKRQQTFEHLGRLDKTLNWGRLRAEKWKRSVNSVLSLWEGWCVFPQESQEHFSSVFNDPPLTKDEEEAKKEAEEEEKKAEKAKKRWKTVDERAAERVADVASKEVERDAMEVDDIDGEPMDQDGNGLDGEPLMEDDDVDGEPMADSDDDEGGSQPATRVEEEEEEQEEKPAAADASRRAALAASIAAKLGKVSAPPPPPQSSAAPPAADAPSSVTRKRQRPKAEDMFASDEEQ
ncbi:MAG: hypothetical protein Q9217_002933 [Psora testacea]